MAKSDQLNDRQRKFAEQIVAGLTSKDAYFSAFPRCKSPKTASSEGSKLQKKPKVAAFIVGLRERVAKASESALTLSMKERREFLARVVRTAIEDIDESSDLCQSAEYQVTGGPRGKLRRGSMESGNESSSEEMTVLKIRVPDKLRAIELDAKLAGDLQEGGNIEVKTSVTVVVSAEKLQEIQARRAAALGGVVNGRS